MTPSKKKDTSPKANSKVEGEGSRSADRDYRKGVSEFKKTHDVDAVADAARKALSGPEAADLEDAEKKAAKGKSQ